MSNQEQRLIGLVEDLNQRSDDLAKEKDRLLAESQAKLLLENQLKEIRVRLENKSKELAGVEENLSIQVEQNRCLEEQVQEMKTLILNATQERQRICVEFEEKVHSGALRISGLNERVQELTSQLTNEEVAHEDLKGSMMHLSDENVQLAAQVEQLKSQVSEKTQELACFKTEKAQLIQEIAARQIEDVEAQVEVEKQKLFAETERHIDELTLELKEKTLENAKQKQLVLDLTQDLDETIRNLENEKSRLLTENQAKLLLEKEVEELKVGLLNISKELTGVEENLSSQIEENHRLEEQVREMQALIDNQAQEVEKSKRQLNENLNLTSVLQNANDELAQKVKELDQQRRLLAEKTNSLERQLQDVGDQMQRMMQDMLKLKDNEAQMAACLEENSAVMRDLDRRECELSLEVEKKALVALELENQVREKSSELEHWMEEVQRLNAQLEKRNAQLHEKTHEVMSLMTEKELLASNLSAMSDSYSEQIASEQQLLKDRCFDLESKLLSHEKHFRELMHEKEAAVCLLQRTLDERIAELETSRASEEELRLSVLAVTKERDLADQALENRFMEIKQLQNQIQVLQKSSTQQAELEQALNNLTSEHAQLKEAHHALESELFEHKSRSDQVVESLKSELDQVWSVYKPGSDDLRSVEEDIVSSHLELYNKMLNLLDVECKGLGANVSADQVMALHEIFIAEFHFCWMLVFQLGCKLAELDCALPPHKEKTSRKSAVPDAQMRESTEPLRKKMRLFLSSLMLTDEAKSYVEIIQDQVLDRVEELTSYRKYYAKRQTMFKIFAQDCFQLCWRVQWSGSVEFCYDLDFTMDEWPMKESESHFIEDRQSFFSLQKIRGKKGSKFFVMWPVLSQYSFKKKVARGIVGKLLSF
eukprot:TRINITY_DN11413_c0_g1_i2.p1 TRINITY_DN11413_c0_g1~~TRINITY_DN11413_c0_g1_i2.p1  ORF type:complete len:1024 (-),score=305.54 TRINITY_DN11413_c0_g1_i2:442-3084(-)